MPGRRRTEGPSFTVGYDLGTVGSGPCEPRLTLYVVASIVVVLIIGYGGCEVIAVPLLITRRRRVVYCPWNTVDLVDKAVRDSPWSRHLQGTGVTVVGVVALVGGFLLLDDAAPLAWMVAAAGSVLVITLWAMAGRASTPR